MQCPRKRKDQKAKENKSGQAEGKRITKETAQAEGITKETAQAEGTEENLTARAEGKQTKEYRSAHDEGKKDP